jgi:hypothetical protein
VPANDGGISLGQAVIAQMRTNDVRLRTKDVRWRYSSCV